MKTRAKIAKGNGSGPDATTLVPIANRGWKNWNGLTRQGVNMTEAGTTNTAEIDKPLNN